MPGYIVVVRILRNDRWQNVDFHTLTDDELAAFATLKQDPLEGWRWARMLALRLAGEPMTTPEAT